MMTRGLGAALVASICVAVPSGAPVQQPSAQAPRRPVPVAANTLAGAPDAFYGEILSITAPVARRLSEVTFLLPGDVLVIAPTLTESPEAGAYVTVVGEAMRFDPVEVARRVKGPAPELDPDVLARHMGRPMILATAVVNQALVDLAVRRPPPLTPEEAAFDGVMKRIGPAYSSLGKAIAGSDAATAAENVKTLATAFAEAEAFWKSRGTADALAWTRDARRHVTALERAGAAGNWEQAKAAAGELGGVCQTCHTAYRERLEDGTFRLRGDAALAPGRRLVR